MSVPVPESGSGASRAQILAAALELLAETGPAHLNLRAVTTRAGCSTTGVYTHFGDKQGLLDAMYEAGFEALDAVEAAPATGDAVADLVAAFGRYRGFAMDSPALYLLMFSGRAQGYAPSAAAQARAEASLASFGAVVADVCAQAGVALPDPQAATRLWAAAHGFVMLELAGPRPGGGSSDALLEAGIADMLRGMGVAG